jgi:hypothetical protein
MYMFRYRRAKKCKACVVNNTNSCATNLTIAQPRNVPPRPNREKVIKMVENGKEVPTFVPNQNTVQDSYFYLDVAKRKVLNLKDGIKDTSVTNGSIFKQGSAWSNGYITKSQSHLESNLGSMGRLARLKAAAISGDKN